MIHIPRIPPRYKQFILPLLQAALAFVLSASTLDGGYAPFSLAVTAAAGTHLSAALCVLSGALGAWVFLDFQPGLRHLASAILILSAALALEGHPLAERPAFRPLASAAVTALVQSIYLIGRPPVAWAVFFAALSAQYIACRLFPFLWSKQDRHKRVHAALLLLGALALSLVPITSRGGFSLGRTVMALPLLMSARLFSPACCCAIGLGAGLLIDLQATPYEAIFAATFACGCAAAACTAHRRWTSAAAYCISTAAAGILFGILPHTVYISEAVSGAVLFLLLPPRWVPTACTKPVAATASPSPLKRQLEQSAAAFRDLYDSFFRGTAPAAAENPSVIFDRAAQQVCRKCVLRDTCWQHNYNETYTAFNDACPHLLRNAQAQAQDFPLYFTSRCIHLQPFLAAVNTELRAFLLRRQYRQRLLETRRQAQEQYAQLGELLAGTATAVEAVSTAAALEYRVGSALRPRQQKGVCGDQLAVFEVGSTLYLLISDGMGSGEPAHREAAMTVRLLQQFLSAGIAPSPALKTLNGALALRGEDGGGFPTIDLLALHRESGSAELYKYGAAPSYCKCGKAVTRFTAAGLPAGLQTGGQAPEYTRLSLQRGSFFVMVSDGIADEKDDGWLQNLLSAWNGTDPEALTAHIMEESRQCKGLSDDCAVLELSLSDGGEKKRYI